MKKDITEDSIQIPSFRETEISIKKEKYISKGESQTYAAFMFYLHYLTELVSGRQGLN